jgi:hypothetical protein
LRETVAKVANTGEDQFLECDLVSNLMLWLRHG